MRCLCMSMGIFMHEIQSFQARGVQTLAATFARHTSFLLSSTETRMMVKG